MELPQITVHPEKRYDRRGRYARGARRGDGQHARTLALFDTLAVRKRTISVHLRLSEKAYRLLVEMAVRETVSTCGLASYFIEKAVRS